MKRILFLSIAVIVFFSSKNVLGQWSSTGSIVYTDDQVGINTDSPATNTDIDIVNTHGYGAFYGIQNQVSLSQSTGASSISNKIAYSASWSTKTDIYGMLGYLNNLTLLKNTVSYKTSNAVGLFGAVLIDDPIPSGSTSTGNYYISGVRAQLSGNISNYPTSGVVSALYAKDYILGQNTWAGYFEGMGYFSDSVGIGTTNFNGYRLSVAGKIHVSEVKIDALPWSDYVFTNDYQLMPISSLKTYIETNNHLPDIPSAKQVEKEGISLGEMDALLLKKIEELTLYVIELKEENTVLQKRISILEN